MEINTFTLFEQGPVERTRKRPYVTIDSKGRLYFNRIALEALGNPEGIALMYDETNQAIGVLPARLARQETYRVRSLYGHKGATIINALNFCRHFSIAPTETLAFQNPRINHDGILVLSLHQVQPAKRVKAN